MEEPSRYRYCPACGEEFRPDIERCSDCGGDLEDRYEGMTTTDEAADGSSAADAPALDVDPQSFVPLHTARSFEEADDVARQIGLAGIAYTVTHNVHKDGFTLNVAEETLAAAQAFVPRDESEGAVGQQGEKGYERCPACGQEGVAGLDECPECGLGLGGDPDGEPPNTQSGQTG